MSSIKKQIKPFDGTKYGPWKIRVRTLLKELDLLDVVDNDRPDPIPEGWESEENQAKSVIIDYLSDTFLNTISEFTSKQIFDHFNSIYERKSFASQLSIRRKLLCLKLEGDTPLTEHFKIFDELVADIQAAGATFNEMDKAAHLLVTLPLTYDGVVTAIETLAEQSITLGFVKLRLLSHEEKLKNSSRDTSAKVLQTINVNKSNINKHFISKNNDKLKRLKMIKCHHCGRKGHLKKNCFLLKRKSAYKNKNFANEIQVKSAHSAETTNGFAFMMANEICSNNDFILDSGASDHIVNQETLFESAMELTEPIKIAVAKNGVHLNATKRGIVHLYTNENISIVLENVLFCAEASHNLLSVRKLQDVGMCVTFDTTGVQITKDGMKVMTATQISNVSIVKLKYIKNYLNSKFCMTDLGEIKQFIGIKIERTANQVTLSQSVYIRSVIARFNMTDCKSVATPLPTKLNVF